MMKFWQFVFFLNRKSGTNVNDDIVDTICLPVTSYLSLVIWLVVLILLIPVYPIVISILTIIVFGVPFLVIILFIGLIIVFVICSPCILYKNMRNERSDERSAICV